MKLFLTLLLVVSGFAYGADVDIRSSDFIERTINFVIFLAILWYFGFDKIKAIFENRKTDISNSLMDVQNQLKASKQEKVDALKMLDDSKKRAVDIVANAKKEAYLIASKYESQAKADIESMDTSLVGIMELEKRNALRDVMSKVVDETCKGVSLDSNKTLEIITKRLSV